jgi:hypothetical protein
MGNRNLFCPLDYIPSPCIFDDTSFRSALSSFLFEKDDSAFRAKPSGR